MLALGTESGNSLQYTGRENDGMGLYHYRARSRHLPLPGWLSEDPIGIEGGINLTAYVGGNPISQNDPLGLVRTVPGPGGVPIPVPTPPSPPPGGGKPKDPYEDLFGPRPTAPTGTPIVTPPEPLPKMPPSNRCESFLQICMATCVSQACPPSVINKGVCLASCYAGYIACRLGRFFDDL